MIRNLKALGLALVAVLAMSAMVASAASAANFTASNGAGTAVTAADTGKVEFKVTGTGVTCSQVLFASTTPGASFTEITVFAEFNGCKTTFGTSATVTGFSEEGVDNECFLNLQADGKADLVCPAGKEVTIEAASCTVHIPAQNNVGTLTYANNGSHVTVALGVTGIKASHTDGVFCPMTGSGGATSAELVTPAGQPLTAEAWVGTISFD